VFLDERNIPWEDKGLFSGMAEGLVMWVMLPMLVATFVRTFRDVAQDRLNLPLWADWPIPVATLGAVVFFHWLANRLAGVGSAALVHLIVGGAAAVCSAVAVLTRKHLSAKQPLARGPLAVVALTSVALIFLVGYASLTAHRHRRVAEVEAAGRPWCVLTFAGSGKGSPAQTWLDLSPLVSRSGGRSYLEDVAWLAIEEEARSYVIAAIQRGAARSCAR
jgi:hypothetical protein